MDILDQVLARAAADLGVRGVILSGSRARGTQNARSDHDVTIVVAEQAKPWRHSTRTDTLDEVVPIQAVRAKGGKEVVAWQHDAAEQQAADPGDQLIAQIAVLPLAAASSGEDPVVDPLHPVVGAGGLPQLLSSDAGVLLQPFQHGTGSCPR